MRRYSWNCLFSVGFCCSLAVGELLPVAFAQNPSPGIDIVVLQGEATTIGARQRAPKDPVVRIENDDHQPVPNVVVVFTLPLSGASGEFANGSKTLTVVTDKSGLATAHGLRANEVPGKLQIYVTASFHGMRATTLIHLLVEAPSYTKVPPSVLQTSKSSGKWKWIALGILAAGGAGAGAYYYKTHISSSPVSISAGTVVFGTPQ